MKEQEALAAILIERRSFPLSERQTQQQCVAFSSEKSSDPAYWFKCKRRSYLHILGRLTLYAPSRE